MKRTFRFIFVLALLLGLMVSSQSAMTGACPNVSEAQGTLDCPD